MNKFKIGAMIFGGFLLFVFIINLLGSWGFIDLKPKEVERVQVQIDPEDRRAVNPSVVCFSQSDHSELMQAIIQGDDRHSRNMIVSGRCFFMKKGEKYFLLDYSFFSTSKIRIYRNNETYEGFVDLSDLKGLTE